LLKSDDREVSSESKAAVLDLKSNTDLLEQQALMNQALDNLLQIADVSS
jgi:hypothetical protein